MSLLIQGLPFFLSHANASRIPIEQRVHPKRPATTSPRCSLLECNPIRHSLQ
jgi:hypothetical protein